MRNRLTADMAILPGHAPLAFDQPPGPATPVRIPGATSATELCQLATSWDGRPPAAPSIAQIKADGHRAHWFGHNGEITTREGNRFTAAWHCRPALQALQAAFGQPMFFDGEVAAPGGAAETNVFFKRGTPAPQLTFWLFDAVPLQDWMLDRCMVPQLPRLTMLERAYMAAMAPAMERLAAVGLLRGAAVADADDMRAAAEAAWSRGHEGVVVKRSDSLYRRGRSPDWIKINDRHRAGAR